MSLLRLHPFLFFKSQWGCVRLSTLLLAASLVFVTVPSISSSRGKDGQCSYCGEQFITTTDPQTGECVACWPCPQCHEGLGSSVPCGSNVTDGTEIHCVSCIQGKSFSNSYGSGQCQPCGVCSGKHERVLIECTPESDVKCECETGFYRNKTTSECLSCDSCCSNDDEIIDKCQKDAEDEEGEHRKPWPSLKSPSAVLGTSSTLVKSSFIHAVSTPSLPGFTKIIPVPSRTQPIRPTATSVLAGHQKREVMPTKNEVNLKVHMVTGDNNHWITALTCTVATFILMIILGFLYKKVKTLRRHRLINDQRGQIRFSTLIQQESPVLREASNTHKSMGTDGPMRNANTLLFEKGNEVVTSNQLEHTAETDTVQQGIPSSLDGKPTNPITKAAAPSLVEMQGENHGAVSVPINISVSPILQPVVDNKGYSTCITDVPSPVIYKMCMLLDIERTTDDNDYRMLGNELGLTSLQISSLKQKHNNPSHVLLMQVFAAKPNSGTVNHLIPILKKMERYDVIKVIDDWVKSQNCTQVTHKLSDAVL